MKFAITIFLGEWLDTSIILVVVMFNAIVGTIQEGRTQNLIASLRRLLKTDSTVVRDGKQVVISDTQLVPGDIIILQEGMRIPADARLLDAQNLDIDEAILTGESQAVHKDCITIPDETRIYEQCNMVFQGTYITSGSGRAIVVATGKNTEIGSLHKIIESIETDFPLKRELQWIARWIIISTATLMTLLFVIGYFLKLKIYIMLITLISLFVAVIPEGLPVIVTLILVRGAYIMAQKNFLIKKLQAVETLGRVNIILTDKTGTITRNEMMVTTVYIHHTWYTVTGEGYNPYGTILHDGQEITEQDKAQLKKIAYAALLSNTELYLDPQTKLYRVQGNQTEAALIVFAKKLGIESKETTRILKPLYKEPFDKAKRYNFGCFAHQDHLLCYMTGSPETIFKYAKNDDKKDLEALEAMLQKGLRVIGIATLEYPLSQVPQNTAQLAQFIKNNFKNIKFAGLFGIQDAIRLDAKESIQQAKNLGINVVLVTGDHIKTAEVIAQEVGIFKPGDMSITGEEFLKDSPDKRKKTTLKTTVYARFIPKEKCDLIATYHQLGQIVAMTGDGVNDAPSLAAADIGIAMGTMGTEVAKQAADVILLNDSFCSIVDGIYEGRNVFYSLRRIISYFFTTNMSEVLIIMISIFLRIPLPLLATQILWMNIVTDGFLDIGLIFEPYDKETLKQNNIVHKHIIDKRLMMKSILLMIPMVIGSLWLFIKALPSGIIYAHTMILNTMILFQWFNAWNNRSETRSIFSIGFLRNKWLIGMTAIVIVLQLFALYTPFGNYVFTLMPLDITDWLRCIATSSSIIIVEEARKLLLNFKRNH